MGFIFNMEKLSEKIEQLVAEFAELEPRERLELLLEYANSLPPLPHDLEQQRLAGEHRVQECQTPVFVWVALPQGRLQVDAWVAPEAPTVKGFVGIVRELLTACTPDEVRGIDTNFVSRFGLAEALGMQRLRGLGAVLHYIKRLMDRAEHLSVESLKK
jgi:cysteine desulfuration protein SufE